MALTFSHTGETIAKGSVSAQVTLDPGDQDRGWRGRWRTLEDRWAELEKPRTCSMSGPNIASAELELLSFCVVLYHLKDHLKRAGEEDVERVINDSPALALLGDLANHDKHGTLSRRTRSGHEPTIGRRTGTSCQGGWRLNLPILHGDKVLDGLAVAADAMDAWRTMLAGR